MTDASRPLELHLLRHADAGDPEAWTGDDAARPLSGKGRRQAGRLGRHLAAIDLRLDAIISSPKLRARETAEIVAEALGATVRLDDRLAGGFGPTEAEAIRHDAGSPRRILLVGHDPDFSELLADLVGAPSLGLKKGALARVDVADVVTSGGGILRWLLPPDVLRET